ncbi:hypothetical protein A2533_04225 [Candidatus Falkowbacteria bacterium RIFOXYD2_FULL_35_9]|uniref:Uncharacterized protein n=1 Tax=Candidatus Falkowbacteria bacterium RIFOXYC2_FULL_36_12 TaxID=1798002 RepID=A0A1F5T303_9BACT|nr:MAG: hypothetical protein A2478_01440 [Candidatus Falkowbacteria bacterium RIFOXYC2_FULL_36_12]OGF33978.1 MAG: hypothetical protein A2223_01920 [Candidatus Falkowbacteria bacterium RIFOXYA2_FULL_35_8]OGF48522.1 MAG: hypothetical protein A2533_04225 [Candidatus Falkowbacteria bacterium RIFOXYD2_FULL_35_9]
MERNRGKPSFGNTRFRKVEDFVLIGNVPAELWEQCWYNGEKWVSTRKYKCLYYHGKEIISSGSFFMPVNNAKRDLIRKLREIEIID